MILNNKKNKQNFETMLVYKRTSFVTNITNVFTSDTQYFEIIQERKSLLILNVRTETQDFISEKFILKFFARIVRTNSR